MDGWLKKNKSILKTIKMKDGNDGYDACEEAENHNDKLIISFYNFVSKNYTQINGLFDLKDTPYWAFDGKTIEQLLLIFKNET